MAEQETKALMEKSLQLFFRYGVRSISMDEIASSLGVSKKTLYNLVDNKAHLIEKVMLHHLSSEQDVFMHVVDSSDNAVMKLAKIYAFNLKNLGGINPTLILELQKYYAGVWKHFEAHKNDFVYQTVLQNIKEGKSQGLYRSEVNAEIISKIYTNRMDIIMDGDLFPARDYSFSTLIRELFVYHIRGIATLEGIKELEKIELNL